MTTEAKHTCWNCGCNPQKERRERIATEVLAGLCANPTPFGKAKELIQETLDISDALIMALDYERGTGVREPLADYVEIDVDSVRNGGDNGEA